MTPGAVEPHRQLWLIDASIWIFRAWFSLPDTLLDARGEPANALQGWAGFLLRLLASERPVRLGIAFDESLESGFRHRLYPDYKSARELPDESLAHQLRQCRRFAELLGIDCAASEEFEADDLIACAARQGRLDGFSNRVVTRDKDLLQVLRDDDLWIDPGSPRVCDVAGACERFGVAPDRVADLQALVGDPVDGIPGLPGIGAKAAAAMLQRWGDLEGVYAALDDGRLADAPGLRGAGRLAGILQAHREQAFLFRRLTRMADDLPEPWRPHALEFRAPDASSTRAALAGVDLPGRLDRLAADMDPVRAGERGGGP